MQVDWHPTEFKTTIQSSWSVCTLLNQFNIFWTHPVQVYHFLEGSHNLSYFWIVSIVLWGKSQPKGKHPRELRRPRAEIFFQKLLWPKKDILCLVIFKFLLWCRGKWILRIKMMIFLNIEKVNFEKLMSTFFAQDIGCPIMGQSNF